MSKRKDEGAAAAALAKKRRHELTTWGKIEKTKVDIVGMQIELMKMHKGMARMLKYLDASAPAVVDSEPF